MPGHRHHGTASVPRPVDGRARPSGIRGDGRSRAPGAPPRPARAAGEGKRAGLGVGLICTGGLLVLSGLAVLIAAAVLALALVVPPWASALIVAGVLLGAAGVLALTGKKQVDQARPPVPEEAIASTRRDLDEVRQRGRR